MADITINVNVFTLDPKKVNIGVVHGNVGPEELAHVNKYLAERGIDLVLIFQRDVEFEFLEAEKTK